MSLLVKFDFNAIYIYVVVEAFRLHLSLYFLSLYKKGGYCAMHSSVKNETLIHFFEDLKRVN
jgi:hypothetical protein